MLDKRQIFDRFRKRSRSLYRYFVDWMFSRRKFSNEWPVKNFEFFSNIYTIVLYDRLISKKTRSNCVEKEHHVFVTWKLLTSRDETNISKNILSLDKKYRAFQYRENIYNLQFSRTNCRIFFHSTNDNCNWNKKK